MPFTQLPTETDYFQEVKFLTDGTFGDILEDPNLLPSMGLPQGEDGHPLTDTEMSYMDEGGKSLTGVEHADLMAGNSALFKGKKCHVCVVEFHFRNDATRHMWGTPVTLETNIPYPEVVEPVADRCYGIAKEKLSKIGGLTHLSKTGYIDTEDRYALWLVIPFDWIIENFQPSEYEGFLKSLFV